MGIIGKLVGGAIGFAMGGPLGAIAGAVFGHAFDKGSSQYGHQTIPLSYREQSQVTFFVAVFSMLAKLTKSDGRISDMEIRTIEDIMANMLKLDMDSRRIATQIFQTALDSPQPFHGFASQFYSEFRDQPQLLEFMLDILLRVAAADGQLSRNEEELIDSAARIFSFSSSRYGKLKSRYVSVTEKYYAVLGCSRNDSDEEIKRQYRKRVSEYHPDKIASKGLPEEFTKLANDKFREIQEAYEAIRKERRIK